MKIVLITCLLQVFLNPRAHTAGNAQSDSFDGTATTYLADQAASQGSVAAPILPPRADGSERVTRDVDYGGEGNVSDQNSNSASDGESGERNVLSSGNEEDAAIPSSTAVAGEPVTMVTDSRTEIKPPQSPSPPSLSLIPPPSPSPSPPSVEGGEDVLTFEEFKKKRREQEMPRAPEPESPQLPLNKAKNNYASFECGARVIKTNEEAQNSMAILTENRDAYMLNPCKANITFTVELCDTVRILKLEMGCFELFSSIPETFRVYSTERHPTDEWNFIGEFNASNERVLQSFVPKESAYAKFVRVEMVSHYGKEHYCPVSVFRVIGASLVEEYEYSEARKTTPLPLSDDETDEYLHSGEEQRSGNGRLLAVAKDAVLSLLEPFSRLGNGLIHKDSTTSNGIPSAGETVSEKSQDVSPSLEAEEHDVQAQLAQDTSSPRMSEQLHRSDMAASSTDALGQQGTLLAGSARADHHGNITQQLSMESSSTLDRPVGMHSDIQVAPHVEPLSVTPVPTRTDPQGKAQRPLETGEEELVKTPAHIMSGQHPSLSIGPHIDVSESFVPGWEWSLSPSVPLATPVLVQQEVPGAMEWGGGGGGPIKPGTPDVAAVSVTPDGSMDPRTPPDESMDPRTPLDGNMDPRTPPDESMDPRTLLDRSMDPRTPPNGSMDSHTPPNGSTDPHIPPERVALGPHSDGRSNPQTPSSNTESVSHGDHEWGSAHSQGYQEDLKSVPIVQKEVEGQGTVPSAVVGTGGGAPIDFQTTPTLDIASHIAPMVQPPPDTEAEVTPSTCNSPANIPLTDVDSSSPSPPPSSSSPSSVDNSPNNSHSQWVVGTGGGVGGVQDHLPIPGSVSREKSVLLRLNDRVKNVEENMSLLSSYLDQVTNSLRKNKNKTDDVQRSLDRSLQTMSEAMQELNSTLVDTVRRLRSMEDKLQSKHFDGIEAHLESIGNTVLNQQVLLLSLSCLTAVLTLLLVVLVFMLCLIRGCGQQARVQSADTTAMVRSDIKKVRAISGGMMMLESMLESNAGGQDKDNTPRDNENLGFLERKRRKGKRNSH